MAFWGPPNILKYVIIIWSLHIAVYPENKEIFIYSDNSLTPSPFIEVPALYFILSRIRIFLSLVYDCWYIFIPNIFGLLPFY